MITLENVTKRYSDNIGLENASIHISRGDFVFLVGPSGAGKSTFIKLLLKEIDADSGRIIVDGEEVNKMSKREIPFLRRKIGIVFQDFRLLPKKTVFENVAFAMEIVHCSKAQIRSRVPQALELVGVGDKKDRYPNELSAGEQQRVAIARSIINKPDLLIADEPTGNLDPVTAKEIMELLDKINQTGTTVVMVTHAKEIVDKMCKRVVAIEKGHIVRDQEGIYGYEECLIEEEENVLYEGESPSGRNCIATGEAFGDGAVCFGNGDVFGDYQEQIRVEENPTEEEENIVQEAQRGSEEAQPENEETGAHRAECEVDSVEIADESPSPKEATPEKAGDKDVIHHEDKNTAVEEDNVIKLSMDEFFHKDDNNNNKRTSDKVEKSVKKDEEINLEDELEHLKKIAKKVKEGERDE